METDEKPKPTLQPHVIKQFHDSLKVSSTAITAVDVPKKEESIKDNDDDDDDGYLDSFPPGYRFCPFDEELVLHYLKKKVNNEPLPRNRIIEVNLYRYNPETLAEKYKQYGEREWYFFTPRDKKYRNGTRPNRAAGNGYWKATGADRRIMFQGHTVGYRKALVFYLGKPPKGDKTNWIMHEYRVNNAPPCKRVHNDMRLDDWVLCRIYKKVDKPISRSRSKDENNSPFVETEDASELMMMDFDYNNVADTMDCSNILGNFMGYCTNLQPSVNDQYSSALSVSKMALAMKCKGQDDGWSTANLDSASQLDHIFAASILDPWVNLEDSIFPVDPPNQNVRNSRMGDPPNQSLGNSRLGDPPNQNVRNSIMGDPPNKGLGNSRMDELPK